MLLSPFASCDEILFDETTSVVTVVNPRAPNPDAVKILTQRAKSLNSEKSVVLSFLFNDQVSVGEASLLDDWQKVDFASTQPRLEFTFVKQGASAILAFLASVLQSPPLLPKTTVRIEDAVDDSVEAEHLEKQIRDKYSNLGDLVVKRQEVHRDSNNHQTEKEEETHEFKQSPDGSTTEASLSSSSFSFSKFFGGQEEEEEEQTMTGGSGGDVPWVCDHCGQTKKRKHEAEEEESWPFRRKRSRRRSHLKRKHSSRRRRHSKRRRHHDN